MCSKVEVDSWKQTEKRIVMKKEADMLESVLWKANDIQARVAELGQDISTDFDGRPVLILGVPTLCLFIPNVSSGNCCM